ncbi:hypothetical protein HRS9139_05856 [Pyrenophora teres f. teres]|nr:hypothetical protein HRS9139_05856 [Pyrenophora teres f. teres]
MMDVQDISLSRAEIAARRDKDDLLDCLDDLLEHYLNTLHEYHKVMGELSTQLSSGYMALAQANFHNSSSAIRYGQDCYDERMQAKRKVHIAEHGRLLSDRPHFSIHPPDASPRSRKASDAGKREDQPTEEGVEFPSATPKPKDEAETNPDADQQSNQGPEETENEKKSSEKITYPLKWFGILVPPALRTAQSTFVSIVEGPIPQLATIAKDLRTQEIEIGRVRKQLKKM